MQRKPVYTKSEIRVALEAYALYGTYKAAGEALKKLLEVKTDQTNSAKEIILAYRYDSEYADIFTGKQLEFKDLALSVAEKAVRLADMQLEDAINNRAKLQKMIKEISLDGEMPKGQKDELIKLLSTMKLDKLGEVATTAGILFDKHRLASGDSTDNSTIKVSYEGGDMNEFGN